MVGASRRNQVFRPGELPLVLLALIEQEPQSGYRVLGVLRERFPGYRASAGAVYPALAALRDRELVAPRVEGSAVYETTPAGRELLRSEQQLVAEIEQRTSATLTRGSGMDSILGRFCAGVASHTGRVDLRAVQRILDGAGQAIAALDTGSTDAGA